MSNRYQNIEILKDVNKKRFYKNNFYPFVEPTDKDLYLITTSEDRYDLLANQYYGDVTLWWLIPVSNRLHCDSLYPPPGIQIRIPLDVEKILEKYRDINVKK